MGIFSPDVWTHCNYIAETFRDMFLTHCDTSVPTFTILLVYSIERAASHSARGRARGGAGGTVVRADVATGQCYLGLNKSGSMLAAQPAQLTARPGPTAGGQAAELPVERLATAEDFTSAVKEGGAGQAEHGATQITLDGGTSHWRDCHFADVPSPSILKHLLKGEGGAAE